MPAHRAMTTSAAPTEMPTMVSRRLRACRLASGVSIAAVPDAPVCWRGVPAWCTWALTYGLGALPGVPACGSGGLAVGLGALPGGLGVLACRLGALACGPGALADGLGALPGGFGALPGVLACRLGALPGGPAVLGAVACEPDVPLGPMELSGFPGASADGVGAAVSLSRAPEPSSRGRRISSGPSRRGVSLTLSVKHAGQCTAQDL